MPVSDDPLPRMLGGRYRLEAKLGSGGMGVVYRAADQTMHRLVAVKLIRGVDGLPLDEEVAGRFLREARNTARIQHENIIEVYDLGRSPTGDMFFVMELLEGESLSSKLRRDVKLTPELGVHIARQICAALQVAHAADIIHRDLKPANVMLVQRAGDDDFVKVLDFGVAKSYSSDQEAELTHTGMLVGTVDYMAPEQIMGRKVDARTDIYSLGVVMYRMFSGKPPFKDGGVPSLIHAHLNVFPKSMADKAPEIPRALDRVVLRCLAKQPEQRYESMAELSRALVDALEPSSEILPVLAETDSDSSDDDPYAATRVAAPARPPPAAAPPRSSPALRTAAALPPRSSPALRTAAALPPRSSPALRTAAALPPRTLPPRPSPPMPPRASVPSPSLASGRPPRVALHDSDESDVADEDATRMMLSNEKPVPPGAHPLIESFDQTMVMPRVSDEVANALHMGTPQGSPGPHAPQPSQGAPRYPGPSFHPAHMPHGQRPAQPGAPGGQPSHAPPGHAGHPGGQPGHLQAPGQGGHTAPNAWNVPTHVRPPQAPSAWQRFLSWMGLGR